MSASKFDGAYWHMIEMQSGNRLLNYEINLVTAVNNVRGVPGYDEDVPFITGTQLNVWNKTDNQKVWFSFGTEVETYLEACKKRFSDRLQIGLSEEVNLFREENVMGYRHQVISDTRVPTKDDLPTWFVEKYEGVINFGMDYWASYTEYKRYLCPLKGFEEDVQKVVRELGLLEVQLVFFADEGKLMCHDCPDITYVEITPSTIVEYSATNWKPVEED